ncbi:hypothetical protein RRG08_018036 [Elysia crispata]|uniref:Uncharacterized protein n=1 Tax=Elysia crispata TaxID=231223 RepID=A0AAE0ZDA4_9GAST|nr:hypothetical protein RRG08_018036 [Elysia crispata]
MRPLSALPRRLLANALLIQFQIGQSLINGKMDPSGFQYSSIPSDPHLVNGDMVKYQQIGTGGNKVYSKAIRRDCGSRLADNRCNINIDNERKHNPERVQLSLGTFPKPHGVKKRSDLDIPQTSSLKPTWRELAAEALLGYFHRVFPVARDRRESPRCLGRPKVENFANNRDQRNNERDRRLFPSSA